MATKAGKKNSDSSANLGFEAKLWLTADKLRNNMDAAEYKHVVLGRVYTYFLTRFTSAAGKNGGQFYVRSHAVRCLVEMRRPYKGHIYDPAGGSGGVFVQSGKFVVSHGGKPGDISIYGHQRSRSRGLHDHR